MEDFIPMLIGGIVGAIAVATENTEERVANGEFFGWLLASVVGIFIASLFASLIGGDASLFLLIPAALAIGFFLMRKAVQRARDAGQEKEMCYMLCIPYVGFLVMIYLIFASRKVGAKAHPINIAQQETFDEERENIKLG